MRSTKNKIVSTNKDSPISMSIDLSGFYRGIVATQRRIDFTKRQIAERILPFYKKIVLRTPVWRGTARLNWYFNVNGKANRSGQRWGGANKGIVDPGLVNIANKIGGGPLTGGAEYFATQNPELMGRLVKQDDYFTTKLRTGVGTQGQFGVLTNAVKQMFEAAERNIEKNFKVVGGGPRSAQMTKITITNHLPYIRFLEGKGGQFGAPYTTGSRIWMEKRGDPFFVRPSARGADKMGEPDPLSGQKYSRYYISRTFGQLKAEMKRLLDSDQRSFHKSLRGRMVGYIK